MIFRQYISIVFAIDNCLFRHLPKYTQTMFVGEWELRRNWVVGTSYWVTTDRRVCFKRHEGWDWEVYAERQADRTKLIAAGIDCGDEFQTLPLAVQTVCDILGCSRQLKQRIYGYELVGVGLSVMQHPRGVWSFSESGPLIHDEAWTEVYELVRDTTYPSRAKALSTLTEMADACGAP